MYMIKKLSTASILSLGLLHGTLAGAASLPPLSENEYINTRLIAAGIGHAIRESCSTISARLLYALFQAKKLQNYALDLGYSHEQIDTFIGDKDEQERVRQTVMAYLAENGVVESDAESYCALGRQEIAKKSITGSLLRSR